MTRSHRSAHRMLWVVLALALGLGLAIALLWRAPAHTRVMAAISERAP
jgi:hypothetical protein